MEEKLNDLGLGTFLGVDIINTVGVMPESLDNPAVFEKIKDIADYLKTVPPEHRSYFMNRVTVGKNVDKLDHLWGYVELNKQKDSKMKELERLKEEINFYER